MTRAAQNEIFDTVINISDVKRRIAVDFPYFAFDSLYTEPGSGWTVYGDFAAEQPLGLEVGPVTTAEVGRHLAILGSCAAALTEKNNFDTQIYYLAHRAIWTRSVSAEAEQFDSSMLSARARIISRKPTKAIAELLAADTVIGTLIIDYHALSARSFELLYSYLRVNEDAFHGTSPYARLLPLHFEECDTCAVVAHLFEAGYSHSSGHFANYPVWPVAIIMSGIGQTASHLIRHTVPRIASYSVAHAKISAEKLIPLTSSLTFSVRLKDLSALSCVIESTVYSGEDRVADLTAALHLRSIAA
ncbi:hypothetical protein [Burkholderia territorii]|uniref:hypothetical protein n=1 Tax=Burkholderia territorii TaxID=1503055 RepID=UPI000AF1CA18|nr:hypothetical protein [Burkholderia territorii]